LDSFKRLPDLIDLDYELVLMRNSDAG